MIKYLLLASSFLVVSCSSPEGPSAEIDCGSAHVCEVPFQLIYSGKDELIGKTVKLSGYLVVGSEPESGGRGQVALLFSSRAQAKLCVAKEAVKLKSRSKAVAEALQKAAGDLVSVNGRILKGSARTGDDRFWLTMELTDEPTLIANEAEGIVSCFQQPPPLQETR
ncbi:hypothetical protein [Novilysobacter erysipheiresistens]|uniref:Lipoprotein n=1 Tax=Novilysobacter erysipheiresistens TaxID=1749332 RepID=A0ABU7Z0C9_9GAMM